MEAPYNLISTIFPEKGKIINNFDKHSKYLIKVLAPTDLAEALFQYAEDFYEAAHIITDFILNTQHPDISKLDTYFFAIAFLYRHCIEIGLKAIGFQYILDQDERKKFLKDTRHNLYEILCVVQAKSNFIRSSEEMNWLQKYFEDISQIDRESDSFRYPFHIVREWWNDGKFTIKRVFSAQTHIDLVKFANKFEAVYEIIKKWYLHNTILKSKWD